MDLYDSILHCDLQIFFISYILVKIFTKVNSKYVTYDIMPPNGKGVHYMKHYAQYLRDIREDSDLTQQQVADILGTSQSMYARYERGANEMPIRHLITLCKYYGISADTVLGLSHKRKRS
jgi:predicted transcriptional regulator